MSEEKFEPLSPPVSSPETAPPPKPPRKNGRRSAAKIEKPAADTPAPQESVPTEPSGEPPAKPPRKTRPRTSRPREKSPEQGENVSASPPAKEPAPPASPDRDPEPPSAAPQSAAPPAQGEEKPAPPTDAPGPGDRDQRPAGQGGEGEEQREHGGRRRWGRRGNRNRNRSGGRGGQTRQPAVPEGPPEPGEGLLEISGKGFGFLRDAERNFRQTPDDIFVTPEQVRSLGLRDGMWVEGIVRQGHRGPQLTEMVKINGRDPALCKGIPFFDELTAINPNKRVALETDPDRYTTRIIDMVAPIGRGQRGLIVAPPRTGKTTLLHHIGEAVQKNYPEMKLMILLVDERPEEVTHFRRSFPDAEVMASSNDSDVKSHTRIAQLAIDRAKRLVEMGDDVFMVLDSITRMGRAFNNALRGGGRTGSGGLDIKALETPRKLFAAARNTREAGSLTIIATALIETGSRMDEVIFQEFKGTGNMELVLDRKVAQMRIYPAVDIFSSGTRREELLLPPHHIEKVYTIRRGLSGHKPEEAMGRILQVLERYPSNAQMLVEIPQMAFE